MSDSDFIYKSQDVDYLGFLEAQLRDMTGIETLTYELIQNADDVREEDGRFTVTSLSFDITDEALIVRNNGLFRAEDFRRLQSIAGGGKRAETGVTGAFGLGFLAVYQVTDAPEIFASGRHWIIRPDAPAERRIEERQTETDGTRFRLPWALDPASRVRRTLRLEAVRRDQLDGFAQQMSDAVAQAALFLKRLERLEVKRNGAVIRRIERRRDGARLWLIDEAESGDPVEWLLLSGDFAAAAQGLRQQYPWQIEAGRQSTVQLAIPVDSQLPAGRLYAGLPTADTLPLALHLNAELFPTTDRKHIHFDDGYQAAWNQAAVMAAAASLADKLDALTNLLTPAALLHLLQSTVEAARQAETGELPQVFAAFWQTLLPGLPEAPLFYTSAGERLPPAQGRLLPPATAVAPEATTALLHALQLPVLQPELAAHRSLLRQLGTPTITVGDIAAGLRGAGITGAIQLSAAPSFLPDLNAWHHLWTLLDVLLRGLPPAERANALADLGPLALALTDRLTLRPLSQVYRGQPEAQALFANANWLHPDLPDDSFPGRYVAAFGVRQAVDLLAALPIDALEASWRQGQLDVARLFRWFERQQIEIFADDPALARDIRRLPLCPVAGELRPLADLFLPGGFADPLQLTGLVDINTFDGRRQFLHDLGVRELDFDTYLHTHLPRVLAQRTDLPSDGRHRLLQLLAARLGEIRDDAALQDQLRHLPLIPCLDGSFRPAAAVYASREVIALLGDRVHIAEPIENGAQGALYEWLGVRRSPTAADLVQALLTTSREWGPTPLAEATTTTVMNCWQALAESLQAGAIAGDALAPLRGQPVIPNGRHVLTVPEAMLVADRSDLAAQFAEWAAFLLPPDSPWLPAALAVGVRPLSGAVTTTVVDGGAAAADTTVQKRISGRYPLLARLLRAETSAGHAVPAGVLSNVKVMALPDLRIQVQLQIGDQVRSAPENSVAAKWIDGVLYLDSEKQPIPWTAVARELAQAVAPGRNTGGLALGIKEVLAAESSAAAAAVLDELGYP